MKLFFSFLLFLSLSGIINAQNDFDIVKQRVVSEIQKTQVNDTTITKLIHIINKDGSWQGIDYTDLSLTGFEHVTHLNNMVDMSLAFNQKKSKFYKSKKLKKLINKSLKLWCDNDYFAENWWFNQIFTPLSLANILLLMDGHINLKLVKKSIPIIGRAHLDAPGARPGGDRIKIGGIAAKKGLIIGNKAQFKKIMKVINDEIKFNTGDRGMQHDYSFHHRVDRVNTTYSYGRSYANVFAEWAVYVTGTEYSFSDEKLEHLINYYLDGICKQFVYGVYVDKGVKNRGITRKETFEPHSWLTPQKLLTTTNYRKKELEDIINLRKGKIKPSASFSKFYWQSDHFVFQRPNFYTSVRLYSVRNKNMEEPYNSEGIFNHFKGDGANFLSIKGDEYLNIWPMYDWKKIPGTTVLQSPNFSSKENVQKAGLTDFVGAVTDGLYGAVAFDFISPHDFIKARKSWFFFDQEYVCLGSRIEATSKFTVATTIDQSLLKGEVVINSYDKEIILNKEEHEMSSINWVHHNGIGYIFSEPTNIHISNNEKSGRWFDINQQWSSSKELVKKDIFKLWIDHGAQPQGRFGGLNNKPMMAKDVTYQYIVVPSARLENMNDDRGIEIISNTRLIQAVKNNKLGIFQIVFYQAGEVKVSDTMTISLDSPGIVMIKMEGKIVKEISVSDPTRKFSRLHMKISGKIDAIHKEGFTSIFDSKTGLSNLTINLPQGFYAGKSVVIYL